jgi:hypothetical protein
MSASVHIFDHNTIVVPAKAGIHSSTVSGVDKWIPAFPTDQVRGLKAHGMTFYFCCADATLTQEGGLR